MYGHQYTPKEKQFMAEYVPGHSHREIQNMFIEKFGWNISLTQVKGYIKRNHLNTGRTGCFQKGHVPHNKGKKGFCALGCEKTQFKKGHIPKDYRPVGSERIDVDGYIEVKVADPNKWKYKHRIVWESVNGKVPKGYMIIFRDNDRTNTNIDNLMLIGRNVNAVMNRNGLYRHRGDFKETAVRIAELKCASSKARKAVFDRKG